MVPPHWQYSASEAEPRGKLNGQSSSECTRGSVPCTSDLTLKCGLVNTNSLSNKLSYISHMAASHKLKVIAVSETWLTAEDNISFVNIPGYEFFRGDGREVSDRRRKHGAGMYISKDIKVIQVEVPVPNTVAVRVVDLDLLIVSIYRPPSYEVWENDALLNFLEDLYGGMEVIVMGDFNLPTLKWPLETGNENDIGVCPTDQRFRDCFVGLGWTQWVEFGTSTRSNNVLDLVLTSDNDRLVDIYAAEPFPHCHHIPIVFSLTYQGSDRTIEDSPKLDWHRGNYLRISEELDSQDWETLFNGLDANICYDILLGLVNESVSRWVPTKRAHGESKWLKSPPRAMKRERERLWKAHKDKRQQVGRNHQDALETWAQYNAINYQYRNFTRTNQKDYEERLAEILPEAPKALHGYLRERKRGCPSVGPLKNQGGTLVSEPQKMADILVEAFASVYVEDAPQNPSAHQIFHNQMSDIVVGVDEVSKVLSNLDSSSALGPDGVHNILLKNCAQSFLVPLVILIHKTLTTSVIPNQWKISQVVPIFKKGRKSEPLNYRPVHLSSCICKVVERVITRHMMMYMEQNNLLRHEQFGFRAGRSTDDQLLLTYGHIIKQIDRGNVVDVIFLDFSKAFDVVSHEVLIAKLTNLGFGDQLVMWIQEFLRFRYMYVGVSGTKSRLVEVKSGVPQGSVVGPLLFLIYVNWIAVDLNCKYYAFADDFKLLLSYAKSNTVTSRASLQQDLNKLHERSISWNLKLNREKCVVMRFGRGRVDTEELSEYTLDGVHLQTVTVYKDLGVWIEPSLRFHKHLQVITGRASALVNQMLRGTICRSKSFMVTVFIAHVRPLLEYCSVLWNVGYIGDMKKLESIQRRWTREVDVIGELGYQERLRELGLYSVYGRLLRADIMKIWKVFKGDLDPELQGLFDRAIHPATRGHSLKLSVPSSRLDVGKKFLSSRCVHIWNRLPNVAIESESIDVFKKHLDSILADKFYSTIEDR